MRLHLIDGTFELFRAHYARRPPRLSPSGQDVKGTVGVVSTLLRLLEDPYDDVTHLAVAFDNPVESFRNRLFSGYKSGEGLDPAVTAQFDLVEDAVDALGVVVWSMDDFEADDALAAGAARWRDEVDQVRILSPDKDLGQCVDDAHGVVQFDTVRRRVIDAEGVRARNGVDPESIPDWLGARRRHGGWHSGHSGFWTQDRVGPAAALSHGGGDPRRSSNLAHRDTWSGKAVGNARGDARGSCALSQTGRPGHGHTPHRVPGRSTLARSQ